MREKAAVFENDLALKSIITQDLNAQNAVSYGVDKDKLKNLGIMSAENLEKGEKMSEIYDLKLSTPKDDKSLFYRRNDLKKSLKPFASKPLINKNDGRVAYSALKR